MNASRDGKAHRLKQSRKKFKNIHKFLFSPYRYIEQMKMVPNKDILCPWGGKKDLKPQNRKS